MAVRRSRVLLIPIVVLAALVALSPVGLHARQGLLWNLLPPILGLLQPVLGLLQPVLGLLTSDLVAQLALAPDQPARIIVRGNVTQLLDVATRHGLPVLRTLDEFIVTSATAAQVAALANESAVKGLSSDLLVVSAMKVSDRA